MPGSDLPECERELIDVIGIHPPKDENAVSVVGAESARNATIPISEGFNLGFAVSVASSSGRTLGLERVPVMSIGRPELSKASERHDKHLTS